MRKGSAGGRPTFVRRRVAEKEEAFEGFDRAVRRSERELAAAVARVKEEEVMDEVVELDVEAEDMEQGIVKEEEEAKVVAAPAGGGVSQWLRGMMGSRDAGALQDPPWDPALLAPSPQTWTPPSSSPRRVRYGLSRFCWCGCTTAAVGGGAVGMGGRGGGCPPGQAAAPGGGQRVMGVAT